MTDSTPSPLKGSRKWLSEYFTLRMQLARHRASRFVFPVEPYQCVNCKHLADEHNEDDGRCLFGPDYFRGHT